MARGQKLEVVSYVRMPDGSRVLFDDLTPEKKQYVREKIVENVGTYILHCLPDKEAAEVCHAGIAVKA